MGRVDDIRGSFGLLPKDKFSKLIQSEAQDQTISKHVKTKSYSSFGLERKFAIRIF